MDSETICWARLVVSSYVNTTNTLQDIGHSEDAREMLVDMYVGDLDPKSAASTVSSSTPGSSATTGGEQNIGLIIAIVVILLAIIAYVVLNK